MPYRRSYRIRRQLTSSTAGENVIYSVKRTHRGVVAGRHFRRKVDTALAKPVHIRHIQSLTNIQTGNSNYAGAYYLVWLDPAYMNGLFKYGIYKQVEGYSVGIPDGSVAQFHNACTYMRITRIVYKMEVINISNQPIRCRFSHIAAKRDVPMIYYTNSATPSSVTTASHPIVNMLTTGPRTAMGTEDITGSIFTDAYDTYNYHTNGFGQAYQLKYWWSVHKLRECRIEGGASSIFYFSYSPKVKLNGNLFMPNMTVGNWTGGAYNNNGIAFFKGLNDQCPLIEYIGESATSFTTTGPTYDSVRAAYAVRIISQTDVHYQVPPYRNTTVYNDVQATELPAPFVSVESSSGTVTTTFTGMPTNPQPNVTRDIPGPI